MKDSTRELMKKFEQDYEVYLSATEALTYWIVYARQLRTPEGEGSHPHHGIRFVTGPNEEGNVLLFRNPASSDAYSAESWGPMETIDDFVKKALARILSEKGSGETGAGGECGTSCG